METLSAEAAKRLKASLEADAPSGRGKSGRAGGKDSKEPKVLNEFCKDLCAEVREREREGRKCVGRVRGGAGGEGLGVEGSCWG